MLAAGTGSRWGTRLGDNVSAAQMGAPLLDKTNRLPKKRDLGQRLSLGNPFLYLQQMWVFTPDPTQVKPFPGCLIQMMGEFIVII